MENLYTPLTAQVIASQENPESSKNKDAAEPWNLFSAKENEIIFDYFFVLAPEQCILLHFPECGGGFEKIFPPRNAATWFFCYFFRQSPGIISSETTIYKRDKSSNKKRDELLNRPPIFFCHKNALKWEGWIEMVSMLESQISDRIQVQPHHGNKWVLICTFQVINIALSMKTPFCNAVFCLITRCR